MKTNTADHIVTRRDMIKASVATAALAFSQYPLSLFGGPEMDEGVLIPFIDPQPNVRRQTRWSELTNWRTKSEDLYVVTHYNVPGLKAEGHTLEISGLVKKPRTLTLDDIKKRKRKTVTATLECGGNGNSAGFRGAIVLRRRREDGENPRQGLPAKHGAEPPHSRCDA
jgi:DMSO/TMAO reductase YedYZ molybdopterin-dependent catalytic subunit